MPLLWLAIHQPLGNFVIARRTAFHRITDQRERRTRKTDQRNATIELSCGHPNSITHIRHGLFGGSRGQSIDIGHCANRVVYNRAFALYIVQIQTHRFENRQQILKNNRSIHIISVHRLHRNRRRDLGRLHHIEKTIAIAIRPIRLHIPPGLTHKPNRRRIHTFMTTRFQKTIRTITHHPSPPASASNPPAIQFLPQPRQGIVAQRLSQRFQTQTTQTRAKTSDNATDLCARDLRYTILAESGIHRTTRVDMACVFFPSLYLTKF